MPGGLSLELSAGSPSTTTMRRFPRFVTAGTYWLSVVPDLVFHPQWGWAKQCGLATTSPTRTSPVSHTAYAEDMAFTINCDPVPEPVTMSLAAQVLGWRPGDAPGERADDHTDAGGLFGAATDQRGTCHEN